jgi:hypothetical protein
VNVEMFGYISPSFLSFTDYKVRHVYMLLISHLN